MAFSFCVKGAETWHERARRIQEFRDLLPNNYSLYVYDSNIMDMALHVKDRFIESIVVTATIMTVIYLLFLPLYVSIVSIICLFSSSIGKLVIYCSSYEILL